MKSNRLRIAIAAVASLAAGSAWAHAPSVTPDIEIWMSGASAQDKGLGFLFSDLCQAGTLDTYFDVSNPAKPGKAHRAFFCTIDPAKVPGLTAAGGAPKVLFHKRSAGGSGMGVAPVADEQAIEHMRINNGNCTDQGGGTWHCTISNPGDTELKVSDAGISDVEPALFVGPNVPAGANPVGASQLARLDSFGAAGLVFGVPVSTNLRNALQAAQGLTVGAEDEANMPSLSKREVTSLFSGNMKKWDEFFVNGVSLPVAAANAGVTPPTDTKVHICRRVPGSGTQAQFNAVFMNAPCTAGAPAATTTSNFFFGPVTTLNSGSGDMTLCLDSATKDANGNIGAANNYWAVGIQSTEKKSAGFRFVKIDGVAPTIQNAANGSYEDWVEQSIQWRKAPRNFNDPNSADVLKILQTVRDNAASPASVAALNTKFVFPWGQGGFLALATNGHAPSPNGVFDINNPVTPYSRSANGLNNCAPAVKLPGKNAGMSRP